MIDHREERAAIRMLAYKGDSVPFLDLIGFDEEYIKLMLLSGLFRSRLYIPSSEKEVEHGYIDIFLQRSLLMPDVAYEWVWELKYLKKEEATEAKVAATLETTRA